MEFEFTPRPPIAKASFWSRDAVVEEDDNFNRWRVVPAAVLTHVCIGSIYAWSLFNDSLTSVMGVVASAPGDWTLAQVVPVFSTAICFAGFTAAFSGNWAERVGPRSAVLVAAIFWGTGLIICGFGVSAHSMFLVYVGYGVVGGLGIGLAYTPPVATLLRWFPDRRGLAAGLVIMGFGGGTVLVSPLIRFLQRWAFVPPEYLGSSEVVPMTVVNGKLFVDGREVVVSTLQNSLNIGLQQGVYVVGTGNNGIAFVFVFLGILYGCAMAMLSLTFRVPKAGWMPFGFTHSSHEAGSIKQSGSLVLPPGFYVPVARATQTRQFALIWVALFVNTTAGIALLSVAKTFIFDVFGSVLPGIASATFCSGFVSVLSLFNALGRLFWAATSDKIGRKSTYTLFFLVGIPLYLSIAFAAHLSNTEAKIEALIMFIISTCVVVSIYGGGFAVAPAYLADVFGSHQVGAIYGRLLTAWSMAGLLGPTLLAVLRQASEVSAMQNLTYLIDSTRFEQEFGVPPSELQNLVLSKSISIAKLLALAPPETHDPTNTIYDSTILVMAGLLVVGLVCNCMIQSVALEFVEKTQGNGDLLH